MLRLRFFPQAFAFSMALVLGASIAPAFAAPSCPIQVEPVTPETGWHTKALETEKTLDTRSGGSHDCRSIRIEVQPEGNALLTFTTTDGRIAVRLLHGADDIPATVEALLVTLPVEKPLETPSENTKSPALPAIVPPPPNQQTPAPPPIFRPTPRIVFDVLVGGRFGIDEGTFSPAIAGQALVLLQPWELGIAGELNPLHLLLGSSAPSGYAMRSFEANFLVGRRFSRGPRQFRLGGSFGFGLVHEEMDADPAEKGRINIDAFQPRLGTYGAVVVPQKDKFRFIFGFHGDMAIWGLRENGTLKRNLPNLSRFGLGITLGVEIAP
jgi:hypothetical protein